MRGDEKMTAALVDRLTHRAHILGISGESYRLRKSLRRQEVVPGGWWFAPLAGNRTGNSGDRFLPGVARF